VSKVVNTLTQITILTVYQLLIGSMLEVPAAGSSSQFPVTTSKRKLFWFNTTVGRSVPLTVPLLSLKQDGTFPVSRFNVFNIFCLMKVH